MLNVFRRARQARYRDDPDCSRMLSQTSEVKLRLWRVIHEPIWSYWRSVFENLTPLKEIALRSPPKFSRSFVNRRRARESFERFSV